METNQLLALQLAASVRSIAIDLRIEAARAAHGDTAGQIAFKAAHPLAEYVPAALAELQAVASLISPS